ncbi:MAG: transposase, partial [Candidatus Thorarchaeota archaeon]
VKLEPQPIEVGSKPPAVIGIDLGIKKAVCSVVLTQKGLRHVRYWIDKEKAVRIKRYDQIVSSLQTKKELLLRSGKSAYDVMKKLREISSKRENISFDYDRKLVKRLSDHILLLSQEYDVYVVIGRLKGIRNRARRTNSRGRHFRGMINRWSFARITDALKHKLSMNGLNPNRVYSVSEAWTSITCHKCGKRGIRPKQSYFLCVACGYRDNADKNAAINIGRRLIKLIPHLKDEKGLGTWLLQDERASPKTPKGSSSRGRSSVPKRKPTSSVGNTVADYNDQTSLEEFESSTDPAMETTMETPSVAVDSGKHSNLVQWTEAQFRERDILPDDSDKTHAQPAGEVLLVTGDSSHEED